jgi:type II secretory pathway pseudopilin PulG
MHRERGFTIVEVAVAATLLIVGIIGALAVFDSGRLLSLVSERQTSVAHRAQQELERVQGLPYKEVAMTAAPSPATGCPSPLTPAYPTSPDCYVSAGSYMYDRDDTSKSEPLTIDATNGTITPNASGSGCSDGCTGTWSDGRLSGEIFTFVSWTSDPNCSSGSICPASNDYKRVTVVVTLAGVRHPTPPVIVSGLIADPDATPAGAPSNSQQNPLQSPNTQCGGGSCNQDLNGSPLTYYLTDTAYTDSYQPPTAANTLHQTETNWSCGSGTCAPVPDEMITSTPTTAGSFPPCFSTDIGCVSSAGSSTGLLLKHPASDSSSCGSPPSDNTMAHLWVTSAIPAGTTVNLTGGGGMTGYLQSAGGTAVNVTLCLAVYNVAASSLANTSGDLRQTPIGSPVSVTTQAAAGSPSPASFGFNLGQAVSIASTSSDQPRLGFAIWLAASAGTDVALVYDHPSFSSQVTLIEQ